MSESMSHMSSNLAGLTIGESAANNSPNARQEHHHPDDFRRYQESTASVNNNNIAENLAKVIRKPVPPKPLERPAAGGDIVLSETQAENVSKPFKPIEGTASKAKSVGNEAQKARVNDSTDSLKNATTVARVSMPSKKVPLVQNEDDSSDSDDSDFEEELVSSLKAQIETHFRKNTLKEAEKPLRKMIQLRPQESEVQWHLHDCLAQQQKWKDAIALLESMDKEIDQSKVQHYLASDHFQLNDLVMARAHTQKALKARKKVGKNANYFQTMKLMADITAAQGEEAESEAYVSILRKNGYVHTTPVCREAFWQSVAKNDMEAIKRHVELGRDTTAVLQLQQNKFWTALEQNPVDSVRLYTKSNFHLRKTGFAGYGEYQGKRSLTPLTWVLHLERIEAFSLLIDQGYDITERDVNGFSLEVVAAETNKAKALTMLLDRGLDVNKTENPRQQTLIYRAAWQGHEDVVGVLLDRGADFNKSITSGWRPLHGASCFGYPRIVRLLLDRGADVEVMVDGHTPLYKASSGGHDAIIEMLLAKGASASRTGSVEGYTPLHIACRNGHQSTAKLLVQNGAVVDAKTIPGCTPLYLAAQVGYKDCVKYLLEQGADPTASAPGQWSAIRSLLSQPTFTKKHEDTFDMLIANGAVVDDSMMAAAKKLGNASVIKRLQDARK